MMYLIESQMGMVKIGYSRNPEYRMTCIQTFSPSLLRIIAKWDALQSEEYDLHRRFASFRSHGEWFSPVDAFADFLAEKRGLGVGVIPTWDNIKILFGDPRRQQSQRAKARWADPVWRAETDARRVERLSLRVKQQGAS